MPMISSLPVVHPHAATRGETEKPSRVRYLVLGMLCLLSFILYLDRVCISQAAPLIAEEFGYGQARMGVVFAAFLIAYGVFEIPAGRWGDRFGSRGVLTRIVIWWSVFTMLTGTAMGFWYLVAVRFLFGAGEAGALPNAARVVARWFPPESLGRAQGMIVTSALIGGATAPVVANWLIESIGWRWSFIALGTPGIAWAAIFYAWFRDSPEEHPAVNNGERRAIQSGRPARETPVRHRDVPWRFLLTSTNMWLLGLIVACAAATTYFLFSWFPTYLREGRGVSAEVSARLSGMALAGGAIGSVVGGWLCDRLIAATGDRRWSRSVLGSLATGSAAVSMLLSMRCDSPLASAAWCTWAMFTIHVQLSAWWGVVADVSGPHLGVVFGLVNSMGVPAGVASQVLLGRSVDWHAAHGLIGRAGWDPAFPVYATVLFCGAVMWLFLDSNRSVVGPAPPLPTRKSNQRCPDA